MMDTRTPATAIYECEPIDEEFWAALPSLDPTVLWDPPCLDTTEQIATHCNTSARIGFFPDLQQIGEQGAVAIDDPNQNLPQEHQESIQGEVGAASTSRVGDLRAGADQNVQRARQGPSVGQCDHPREQTTLQPLQLHGQLQGAGVQPNVLTTVRGGHQPQYGGIRNNTNPALPQQKYQPQHGVQHNKSELPLQQAPAQKQFQDSHQQCHQGQGNGTGHQSTNAYNFSMEGPSHRGNMSPNIQCVRCGNPKCKFLANQILIDKPTYWCQKCQHIMTVSNMGGPLGYATPLSDSYSGARSMASGMIRNQTPLDTSQPGQVIAGPVRSQHADWCGTLNQHRGKASDNEGCGTLPQIEGKPFVVQHLRQQLFRSNSNDVQHQQSPKPFIAPNQTPGFGQDQPLQQQGYQNFEPHVANYFPQRPRGGTSFAPYPGRVGCNQGLLSVGNPYLGRDTNLDGMRYLGQQNPQIQQPNNMIPAFNDLTEQQRKNQSSGQQPIAKTGKEIPRKASKEPAQLIGVDKPCQWCHSKKTRFKFFCNKKVEQPRYQCGVCRKHFTFGGRLYQKKLAKEGLQLQYKLISSPQKRETNKGKSIEESEYDSGDDESSDEEEVLGQLTELAEEKKKEDAGDDDDASESSDGEEKEEPADLVDVIKPCKWCTSSNTRFCHPIDRECQLLEYQCDDCSFFLRYDRTARQVVQDAVEGAQSSISKSRRYSLRSNAKPDPTGEP